MINPWGYCRVFLLMLSVVMSFNYLFCPGAGFMLQFHLPNGMKLSIDESTTRAAPDNGTHIPGITIDIMMGSS